jgi:hypothetical protein
MGRSESGAIAGRPGEQLPAIPTGGEDSFNRVVQTSAMAKKKPFSALEPDGLLSLKHGITMVILSL